MDEADKLFAGAVPEIYDTLLVPLIFEPYATDLAGRVAESGPRDVLEIAAGTGVLTRAMASLLEDGISIVATDLNQPMIDKAVERGTDASVTWRQADALSLPFEDASFDTVVCQFGVMFFPDRATAYREARRVLKPGGVFIFNTWDRIEANEFAHVVTTALEPVFSDDPPRFLERTPHGYHDRRLIEADLAAAGFRAVPAFDSVSARSRAASCRDPAIAYVQGTPLRNEIEARDPSMLSRATDAAADAIAARFGRHDVDGGIRAWVVSVPR